MPWTSTTTRATGFAVTAAVWNAELVDNMQFLEEVAYAEATSDVSITGTSNVQIVSAGAVTFEAVPHLIEFWCRAVVVGGSGSLTLRLRDSTTSLGDWWLSPASVTERAVYMSRRLTPSAGSHTYNIAGANGASQTSTITAGAGGAGNAMPAFIRITRIPT